MAASRRTGVDLQHRGRAAGRARGRRRDRARGQPSGPLPQGRPGRHPPDDQDHFRAAGHRRTWSTSRSSAVTATPTPTTGPSGRARSRWSAADCRSPWSGPPSSTPWWRPWPGSSAAGPISVQPRMAFQPCDHRWVAEEIVAIALGDAPPGVPARHRPGRAGADRPPRGCRAGPRGRGQAPAAGDPAAGGRRDPVRVRVGHQPARRPRAARRAVLPRLAQTVSALVSASSLPMVSLASPNSSVVVGS